ncbi:MAG: hypothetical protein A2736_01475 [Candidatus Yanofskybacteria bacterium RIFCSPHIGHO2_01_FULL_41_27]|uniref:Uncharacterized protein n=6 Tax=Parcubacteria group TaxID=1794811 RepID=A0A1F8HVA3_9BACT|nr:MAG: hypothetical protein UU83_C0004G0003 [Candidatus Jorgensenbacteria bacterium GW2011_GWF2_41_8]KKS27492.1 MAG: hypothetical protein UU84_C0004G0006 [Candidatus Yanofskybacteria bacterium GW2011_GWC2_41_9]KKU04945.1 MAG: hypothetical protein UX06_C0005G0005 [Candidatus Giovannonibacteria bacterium GW2011_GWA2_45_21]KKU16477.1 MAG: hypothetical protein UX24_C0009G0009 [Candidatus Giovannonibacteria bacterium GW2011_GWB1_45_9b]OGN00367.1 MAG: hypothetical protein A2736_01475 [Candidatus Yan
MSRKILIINIINQNRISIQIKNASMETEDEYLTPGQGSDNMLIRLLDKILLKNKIKKSSLKNIEIQGEIRGISALGLVARAIKEALLTLN